MHLKCVTLFIALLLSVVNALEIPNNVFISNLHRQFEVGSSVVRENIALSVKSKEDGADFFYLTYKKDLIPNISTMVAFTKVDKENVLNITQEKDEDR